MTDLTLDEVLERWDRIAENDAGLRNGTLHKQHALDVRTTMGSVAADERARIVWWLRAGIDGPAAVGESACCLKTLSDLADVIEQHPDRFAQAPTGRERTDASADD